MPKYIITLSHLVQQLATTTYIIEAGDDYTAERKAYDKAAKDGLIWDEIEDLKRLEDYDEKA